MRSASDTARLTTIMRAAHQVLDDDPKILVDPIAVGLVPGSSESEIVGRRDRHEQPRVRWTRSQIVLRNRYAEDQLREAAKDGVRQYLLLGAGYDTFAFRQPAWASQLAIIEVDHPNSQQMKLECLDRGGLLVPGNLSFCPVDFEQISLADGLASSQLDNQSGVFVSWLGVVGYLTRQAIEAVLRYVLLLPQSSRLVMTFMLPISSLTGLDREAIEGSAAIAADRGEPLISSFEPDELRSWLVDLGFSQVVHFTPEQAQARYFADRADGLAAPRGAQLMCAWV